MMSHVLMRLSSFADYESLSYSNKNIKKIFDFFSDVELLPNIIPEISQNGKSSPRMQLKVSNFPIIITILTNRIDIDIFSNNQEGFNEEEKSNFNKEILKYMKSIVKCFSSEIQFANRLAWFVSYIYYEISEEDRLNFKNKYLNKTEFFNENETDDFNVRYCSRRISELIHEQFNIIMSIGRLSTISPPPQNVLIDGYKIDFDINTIHENKKNRFSEYDYDEFLKVVLKYQEELEGEFINVYR